MSYVSKYELLISQSTSMDTSINLLNLKIKDKDVHISQSMYLKRHVIRNFGMEKTILSFDERKELQLLDAKSEIKHETTVVDDKNIDLGRKLLQFPNPNMRNANLINILDKQVKACTQCDMTFRYKRHLDRHLEGHQKNNCSHCSAKFARRKHLEVHLFRSHGERITKYPHPCDMCSKSFPKKILLNQHRAKHSYENGRVCSECGELLTGEVDDNEHKESHCAKKLFKCNQCLQTFKIEQTYFAHLQNHDNYKCTECDITSASKKKAHEHYKLVHAQKLSDTMITNDGGYYCADCSNTFFKKDEYSKHLKCKSHLDKVCGDTFSKIVLFPCSVCSKKLISQRALDQHVRRIHKGGKRFLCNIYGCTFQCARRTDLLRHKKLHVEQRNVVCEHCGKTFTSVSILNDHVLYVHSKERQFICEECGKAFKRNSLLKRHKLSHQQHRPFACMQCSTAFKRSHHLTRHMEKCHRIMLERKKKVVKLMKTEDGNLIPVPEPPRKITYEKFKMKTVSISTAESNKELYNLVKEDIAMEQLDLTAECETLYNSADHAENSSLSVKFSNSLPVVDSPQVLSLADIKSGEVVTVEVTCPETLVMNDLIAKFETNCNEAFSLSAYQDLESEDSILNTEQNYYSNVHYSEAQLEGVEEASLLLDSAPCKLDNFLLIENYLTQSSSSLLNL